MVPRSGSTRLTTATLTAPMETMSTQNPPEGEEHTHYHTATDDHGHIDWNVEVTEETCFMMINAALSDMDEGNIVSMFFAMVMGPMASIDDNGNEIPDCIEMMMNDGSDRGRTRTGTWRISQ